MGGTLGEDRKVGRVARFRRTRVVGEAFKTDEQKKKSFDFIIYILTPFYQTFIAISYSAFSRFLYSFAPHSFERGLGW